MPFMTVCPMCHIPHQFIDSLYAKVVKCKNCQQHFHAGQPERGAAPAPAPEPQEAVTVGAPKAEPKAKSSRSSSFDRPAPFATKPKPKSELGKWGPAMIAGAALGSLLLVVGGAVVVGVLMWFLHATRTPPAAVADPLPPPAAAADPFPFEAQQAPPQPAQPAAVEPE
jgi:hypothetical protein